MPATQVSPLLRRQLSDEARRYSSITYGALNVQHLSLPERLQNFRADIRLDIPHLERIIQSVLIVSGMNVCYQYHLDCIGSEVSVLSKAGSTTKWITHTNGINQQLREYLHSIDCKETVDVLISNFLEMIEKLDLKEVFTASKTVSYIGIPKEENGRIVHELRSDSLPNDHSYMFHVDAETGIPISVIQYVQEELPRPIPRLIMHVDKYSRYDGELISPVGIQSDIMIMIDTAMHYFNKEWLPSAKEYIYGIFEEIDNDGDGFINGSDLSSRLQSIGQSAKNASHTSKEMVRLLCDANDPSEEFDFYHFCGFWMVMLSDGSGLYEPFDQVQMIMAFRQLFYGELLS